MKIPASAMTNSDTPPLIRPEEQVVLYDGTCKLCNGWVNFLLRYDRYRTVRLAAVQSEQGKTLLRWAGLPEDKISTIVLIAHGQVYLRADAIFRVMGGLPRRGACWRRCAFCLRRSATAVTILSPATATGCLAAMTACAPSPPTIRSAFSTSGSGAKRRQKRRRGRRFTW